MKKISFLFLIILTIAACSRQKESNLFVNAEVKGLKKGTLFLQKIEDTSLVNLDSVVVNGNSKVVLETYLESPEMLYLYLEKVDNNDYDDRIGFFADEGEVSIITNLEKFESEAKIVGSRNQEKLAEYQKMMQRFNDSNLDIIKENFEAQQAGDDEKLLELDQRYEKLLKRRYLYTVNYAINNKDLEIAPYLALSEVFDANIKYLDTIYTSLEPQVKKSKYGKALEEFIEERKKEEEELAQLDDAEVQE